MRAAWASGERFEIADSSDIPGLASHESRSVNLPTPRQMSVSAHGILYIYFLHLVLRGCSCFERDTLVALGAPCRTVRLDLLPMKRSDSS